jgi:hypothetical protein
MILSLAACNRNKDDPSPSPPDDDPGEAEAVIITRGQWVQMLAGAMGSSIPDDADIFFTDVSSGNAIYNSVQTAASYNWIDTDADTFNPDANATRAFVAVTTAKALGFVGEPVSMLSDIAGQKDAEYIRHAVDAELLSGTDGSFNPSGTVTMAECEGIAGKVRSQANITIDPNHIDTVTYNEGVVDLSQAAGAVTFNDPGAMTVTMTGDAATDLTVGSVYLLPPSKEFPYGVARKVRSISQSGNTYTIVNEEPTIEEIVSEIDIQGVYTPDFSKIIWEPGVTAEVIPGDAEGLSAQSDGFSVQPLGIQAQPLVSVSEHYKINFGNGLSATLSIHDLRGTVKVQKFLGIPLSATVKLDAKHTLSMDFNLIKVETRFAKFPIPLTPGISLMVGMSLGVNGDISFSLVNEMTSEMWFNSGLFGLGMSARTNVIENRWDFNVTANVEAGVYFAASLNFWGLDLIEGTLFLGVGVWATMPNYCMDVRVYLACYLKFALLPQFKDLFEVYIRIDIWNHTNSPFVFDRHYENGVAVEECTRTGGVSSADLIAALWEMLGGDGGWRSHTRGDVMFGFSDYFSEDGDAVVIYPPGPLSYEGNDYSIVTDIIPLGDFRYRLELRSAWGYMGVDDFIYPEYSRVIDLSNFASGIILFGDIQYRWVDSPQLY